MSLRRHRVGAVIAIGFALASAGCGGTKVYPVKGKVTFDGKPMKGGGSIAFMPMTSQEGKTAGGTIDPDGNYELMTNKPGDGSMPGEFRVVINQVVEDEPEAVGDGEGGLRKPKVLVASPDRIPEIYGDAYNSPLRATVQTEDNEINFDLKRNLEIPGRPPGAMRRLDFRRTYASR